MTTVPSPVIVNWLPVIAPGPEIKLKVTGRPEFAVAFSAIGPTPSATGEVGCVKVIVWLPMAMPDKETLCATPGGKGEFQLLSVITSDPLLEPFEPGMKLTA